MTVVGQTPAVFEADKASVTYELLAEPPGMVGLATEKLYIICTFASTH